MTRPLITTDPAVNFGRPMVGSAPVEAVCSRIWAGETVVAIADDYGLSWAQVHTACWYQARYGNRTWRTRWARWATDAAFLLHNGRYDAIPDPPTKEGR